MRLSYEIRLMARGAAVRAALALYVFAAVLAVVQGMTRIERQREAAAELRQTFAEDLAYWQARLGEADPGDIAYYLFAPTDHEPSAWAPIAVGQRDTNMLHLRVRVLALQGQLYTSEIHNPTLQMAGYLDLGFVLVYLLPLLIGALCATFQADEREAGRWPLLVAAAGRGSRVLRYRFALRFGAVWLLNVALLAGATAAIGGPFDARFVLGMLAVTVYQIFWFLLVYAVVARELGRIASTLTVLGAWLALVIIYPGLANLYLVNAYRTPANVALTIEQREVMNNSWDRDKPAALRAFVERYPEWADTPPLANQDFHWKWYHAMQHMSDVAAAPHAERYRSTLLERQAAGDRLAWFSPPLAFQSLLTRLADTDLRSQLDYLDQVARYHDSLRAYYYPVFFFAAPFDATKYRALPEFRYERAAAQLPWSALMAPAMACVLMAGLIAVFQARARD
jgi:ABC-2 type transport system permease protein